MITTPTSKPLRNRLAVIHRAGVLWGWVLADDDAERRACLDELGRSRIDNALRGLFTWADRKGLRPGRIGPRVVKAARGGANFLRL